MGSSARVPGLARAMVIEWRARRIADPLWQLKYLRRVTGNGGRLALRSGDARGLRVRNAAQSSRSCEAVLAPAAEPKQTEPPPAVWLVEKTEDHESYGLRPENRHSIETRRLLRRPELQADLRVGPVE